MLCAPQNSCRHRVSRTNASRLAIVPLVFSAFTHNDIYLSMLATLVGEDVDLEPSRRAFTSTTGDFRAKLTSAIKVRLAQLMTPEVFIEIPERPEELWKSDLDALVRPVAHGFLRSYATKPELLDQLHHIHKRQQSRPSWIPRIGPDGEELPLAEPDLDDAEAVPDRPLEITALAEIGAITVQLPAAGWDRPELPMADGGVGQCESALFTALGLIGYPPGETMQIDAAANEALVPDEVRWWSPTTRSPDPPTLDPGVVSELLATSATLGGMTVADNTSSAYDAVGDALARAGDWRYGPRWLLLTADPADDAAVGAVARAAIAGWADEQDSGLVVYVHGGALHATEGLCGDPHPLHSFVLTVTRASDGTDAVAAISRVTVSCPGEHWCHRGGCPDLARPDIAALLSPIPLAATAAEVAADSNEVMANLYSDFYGDGDGHTWADDVLDEAAALLSGAGWIELEQSEWEGGVEERLLRRGEYCLEVRYDPATRQVELVDGRPELELTLQLLADDGLLTGDEDAERVDLSGAAVERWNPDLLAAAGDLLQHRILELDLRGLPAQLTVLGLHPHADGLLRGPHATTLAAHQLRRLFRTIGLLGDA
jgi:hypothetical protein